MLFRSAESAGHPEEAEAILEQPRLAPVVTVAPEVAKVVGISERKTLSARVTSMRALIVYVAANPQWTELLLPNMPSLNALARSMRKEMRVPGVEVVETVGLASRNQNR